MLVLCDISKLHGRRMQVLNFRNYTVILNACICGALAIAAQQ